MDKQHGLWFTSKRNYVVTPEEWENRCQWEHLTDAEKQLVCQGGCGLDIFGYKIIPNIIFKDCCCHHDFAYLRGGDERVRKICENAFKEELEMKVAASEDPAFFGMWAKAYAATVSKLGWFVWDYGPLRTKEQILALAVEIGGA